ncbi:ABC transporter substrate-binding protein [Vannielia litorea]|uniref:MlaC/ttg2D family ABC transporter substrate-binding protein n=1 Tax=Vannielia TaxID=2813041 RepID=UPI001C9707E3|nr:ABC transporter substrate-binding protein [Vannielia litorea]MBY6049090.1 ABC transporter substrate-binding protein [Vannielia litorea]MBY6076504.1 ABC transporter substrate-binding protein [Vannielia litorea]MBY6154741.1 ABC transporter substrate-binding protein [Vannielia litorea]
MKTFTAANDTGILTRRSLLTGAAALTASALTLPREAFALSAGASQQLVTAAVNDINKVIASGKSERAMYGDFQRIFVRYSDLNYISFYSLGSAARSASKAQMQAYTQAFSGYISRKYGRRFREFIGGRIEVKGARSVKNWIEVDTMAVLRGSAPFDVTFFVSDKSGSHKFFNLFIADVNMLLTERTEIGAMLDRRGGKIDALIADLKRA